MNPVSPRQLMDDCLDSLEDGDLFEAELALNEYFEAAIPYDSRPFEPFPDESLERLCLCCLMSDPRSPAGMLLLDEATGRGIEIGDAAELMELPSFTNCSDVFEIAPTA